MNHIYKTVFNASLGTWVAVSELATGKTKNTIQEQEYNSFNAKVVKAMLLPPLFAFASNTYALPTGNELIVGQATVNQPTATQLQINQGSDRAVINWQNFSVGQNEAVHIQQPHQQAALLNRVVGQDASQIQGKIQANGQVYLTNPNGVVFSKTAQVDVGGLVASTHDISTQDFMNGTHHFTQSRQGTKVENHGAINATDGGVVALIGEQVINTGTINTPKGTTALAAGKTVDLDMKGDGLVEVKVSEAALNAQIENHGVITADAGRVVMSTKAANSLMDTVINQNGIVKARGMTERNGEIILEGGLVSQTGTLDVSGKTGGNVEINARAILDAGKTNADGADGKGGNIKMTASDAIIQTAQADTHANGTTQGGMIQLDSQNSTFSSGKLSSQGETGGTINILSNNRVVLAAADVNASGNTEGGTVKIGGDFHGTDPNVKNAKTTIVNGATKIKADGSKGKVVVWSDKQTDYYGAISANKQGEIEVSSKGTLTYAGMADAGLGGSLLLDPKNIIITSSGGVASYELIDPHKAAGNQFGYNTALLGITLGGVFAENGNIVVSSPFDDFGASNAGAVYLFNVTTGALLSSLTGSTANNQVGHSGVTALKNGNYVVNSGFWDNGAATDAGAVTWGNGLTGVSGVVSNINSLVGSTASDNLGINGIIALDNGNYLVNSYGWDNGAATDAGAVTWGSGLTGVAGVVNSSNSLVGSTAFDALGNSGITVLSNGNYVVSSYTWDDGSVIDAGAVTWGSGTTGITGVVSSANSLVGSTAYDYVGNGGITALNNGNYVVSSLHWDNGAVIDAGAVTWGNGTTGRVGAVNSNNSLVGTTDSDYVGRYVTALSNGNYVVSSDAWDNGAVADVGAVTWNNGTTGRTGVINNSNSLIGSTAYDNVGSAGVIALNNGNYVFSSLRWDNGSATDAGAVTWGNGATGRFGVVGIGNSLIGSTAFDYVGNQGITALSNGNYVVASYAWDNGSVIDAGAVTWGNGTTGSSGVVSNSNSLVGSTDFDSVGVSGITVLNNGNYVVSSYTWDNGAVIDAGAVTWGNGATGSSGVVSINNSLVGTTASDNIGNSGITALNNGNYVVSSGSWDNGSVIDAGAVTWANGATGRTGAVSTSNSLVGSKTFDYVGLNGVTALTNGNYVVGSGSWDNGTITDAGAATWGNGITGTTGVVSSNNSLVGTTAFDYVGSNYNPFRVNNNQRYGVIALSNGNYVVINRRWDNGTITNAGAVTWGNGTVGSSGLISSSNSLVGLGQNDFAITNRFNRSENVIALNNGDIVVASGTWDNIGALVDAGQVRVWTPQNIAFNNGIGQTMTFNPSLISQTLALGTNVTLQANNDITLDVGTNINVSGSAGGKFTLQAGRNITLNSSITTANGDFLAIAGDPNAISTDREAGTPTITLGNGVSINAGTGKVTLAAINGNFNNNTGSTNPITASQWLIYSTDPRNNQRNGMIADNKHYAQTYTGATPNYTTQGNWFLYSITPTLSVTPIARTVNINGFTFTSFTYGLTGFIDDDTKDSAGITGFAQFGIDDFNGKSGLYNVRYLQGLASKLGYNFIDNSSSINELQYTKPTPIIPPYSNLLRTLLRTQRVPLQFETIFWNWLRYASRFEDVDFDFGQYKHHPYQIRVLDDSHYKNMGKHRWHEKRHSKNKLKKFYKELLFVVENAGIKLPFNIKI